MCCKQQERCCLDVRWPGLQAEQRLLAGRHLFYKCFLHTPTTQSCRECGTADD